MDIAPRTPAGRQSIESYGGRRFRVSGQLFEGSVLVLPSATDLWPPGSVAEMTETCLDALLAPGLEVELLLLGCGTEMAAAPPPGRSWHQSRNHGHGRGSSHL